MENIEKIPLSKDWSMKSSQILRTTYNRTEREMIVQFKTAIWAYSAVSLEVWKESLEAESIGKFVNTKIKPNHAARKIS